MSEITCRSFESSEAEVWDEYIRKSNCGTMFNERRFLNYHPPDRFEDHSLVFDRKGQIAALFPACVIESEDGRELVSHRGASFGGIITDESSSIKEAFDLTESLLEHARSEGFYRLTVTMPPIIYHRRLSSNIDFAFIKNGFRYLKRELSSVLSLRDTLESNLDNFKPESRTAYRKAVKLGVETRWSDDYESFWKILKNNLWTRHNVTPTHTLEEMKILDSLYPESIHLLGAYVEDEMVAGVVLFEGNPQAVIAFYISHKEESQKYRAVNLLFYDAVKWAIENNFKYLDYGIFTVNMEPNWGLGRFKESFGASGLFRDTFQIDL